MARGYSRDLRERLLQAVASGLSVVEVARRTGVSESTIGRYKRKAAADASLEPGTSPGGPRKIPTAEEDALRAQVAAHPDATLAEHGAAWAADGHASVRVATMSRALAGLGLPLKKTLIATERDEDARRQWWRQMAKVDPATVVFLDETSTQTPLTRSRGRAPRGERVVGAVPRNHGANITSLVAMGPSGMQAPCVFAGAVTSALFVRWLRRWLVPTLPRGTTVILDNLRVHRNTNVRTVIEAAGCHLQYLPAYSPDFNPIEQAFAKLKAHLRATGARAFEPLADAIGDGLDRITTGDIAGFYRHCGFALPPDPQPS